MKTGLFASCLVSGLALSASAFAADPAPSSEAKVSVEDRGFLFADGVYEALRVYNGRPFCLTEHLDRLERSCNGIELPLTAPKAELHSEIVNLVKQSATADALVYLQVTRGPGPRNHVFPKEPRPTIFFYVRAMPPVTPIEDGKPYTLLSVPDERWSRCWIKSIWRSRSCRRPTLR